MEVVEIGHPLKPSMEGDAQNPLPTVVSSQLEFVCLIIVTISEIPAVCDQLHAR